MEASEFAAVVVAVASVVAVTLAAVALVSITKTLRELRTSVEQLRTETMPVLANLREATTRANGELDRVDSLLGTAESIGATVDSASRLAYLALSNPVIKGLALASGTTRAYKRLRRGSDG